MPEVNASSKFKILNAPVQLPGHCISCGASRSDDRDYIDFGMDMEWYGVVYFCTFCFTECANSLGYLSSDQSTSIETEIQGLRQYITNFRMKEVVLDNAITGLRDAGLLGESVISEHLLDAFNESTSNEDGTNLSEVTSGSDDLNSETEQFDSKQGSNDVSSSRSNDYSDIELEL